MPQNEALGELSVKIEGVGTTAARSVKRRSDKKATKGQGSFSTQSLTTMTSSQASAELPSVQGVDSLLATQEMPERQWQHRQSYQRGQEMLEGLDCLRLEILSGGVPLSRLKTLQQQLNQKGAGVLNSELKKICELIEQRLAVEVAKLEQAQKV